MRVVAVRGVVLAALFSMCAPVAAALEHPNANLTPGAVILLDGFVPTAAQVCQRGYARRERHRYDASWRHFRVAVFAAYHVPHADWSKYTLDHLIPIELGGLPFGQSHGRWDIRNVWPQPRAQAKQKDAVEDALHAAVCVREGYHGLHLSLATAEAMIARDWTRTRVGLSPRDPSRR